MKVDAGRGKLYDAQKVVRLQWDQVGEFWTDGVHAEFEEKIWEPMDQMTSESLRAIDRLARILSDCRRDCEGEQM